MRRVRRYALLWGGLSFIILFSTSTLAEAKSVEEREEVSLEEVRILAQPLYEGFERSIQEVRIIDKEELKRVGVDIYSGLDLRERGGFGVQEDLSIRGTTFEQNVVLFEGIRLSDLQTGHHLMNLPLGVDNIAKLEIVPGGVSPLYGAGGFGGLINLLLEPSKEGIKLEAGLGSYDLRELAFRGGIPLKGKIINLSLEQGVSNGFIWNRDFDIRTFNLYHKGERTTLFYGFVEKDFGARNFYTPRFDSEWEETRTHLILAKRALSFRDFLLEPTLLYRKNYDHYLLNRKNPAFYQNRHETYAYRFNFPVYVEREGYVLNLGLEAGYESLNSSRLGEYLRRNISLYGGIRPHLWERFYPLFQVRYDYHLGEKDFLSWGVGFAYKVNPQLKARVALNYSYRLPSATELRYQSLAIKGNPDLEAERALNLETGMDFTGKIGQISLTAFHRFGEDLIDWFYNGTTTVARNLNLKTLGFTFDYRYPLREHLFILSYTYLNQKKEDLAYSRYLGNYLRHNLVMGTIIGLPYGLKFSGNLNYQKRGKQEGKFLFSSQIEKSFGSHLKLVVWGKNLLDEKYYEIWYPEREKGVLGIPQWFGLRLELYK